LALTKSEGIRTRAEQLFKKKTGPWINEPPRHHLDMKKEPKPLHPHTPASDPADPAE